MPRRRKNNKRSLSFEESPKNIVRNLPSPVYGADHPPTADIVNLEDSVNIPWVSPDRQLVNCPLTQRCRRTRRFTGIKPGTSAAASSNVTQSMHKPRVNSKIKALKFIGDISIREASTAEDISVDELLSENEANTHRVDSFHKGRRVSQFSKYMHENQQDSDNNANWTPVLKTRTARVKRTKRKTNRDKKGKINVDFSSDSEVSLLVDGNDRVGNVPDPDQERNIQVGDDASYSRHSASITSSGSEGIHEDIAAVSKVHTPEITNLVLRLDDSPRVQISKGEDASLPFTQHRPVGGNANRNARRLFNDSVKENIDVPDNQNSNKQCTKGTHLNKTPLRHLNKAAHDRNKRTHCDHIKTNSFKPRRSLRIRQLIGSNDFSPDRSNLNADQLHTVLVYDTPEEDYSVPVRQRRLRNWRKMNESLRIANVHR